MSKRSSIPKQDKQLGKTLERLRLAQGLSLRSYSKEIGVCRQTLARMETGDLPNGNTLTRVLRFFGFDLTEAVQCLEE